MHIAVFIRRYIFGDSGEQPQPDSTLSEGFPWATWAGFFAWTGFVVGILGTTYAALLTFPFFWLHHDIGNGGLLWFAFVGMTAFFTVLIGLPCAIFGMIFRKDRRLIGWLGITFSLAPGPLAWVMVHIAMALNGFHFTS
jgi:hypothetical protein